jgi:hypothetical protein
VIKASKQGFNTEITEKKVKPQSCTEKIVFVTLPLSGQEISSENILSVQLCSFTFFSVTSVLKPCFAVLSAMLDGIWSAPRRARTEMRSLSCIHLVGIHPCLSVFQF